MNQLAKFFIAAGVVMIIVGVVLLFGNKLNLGKLPGDINIQKENYSFHFPIVTSIIISIIISLLLNIFFRGK